MKGHLPWNTGTKGVVKAWNKGLYWSKGIRQKISKAHIGKIPWNKGISFLVGEKNPMYGKLHSLETRKKIGKKARERLKNPKNHPMYGIHRFGKINPNWKGGNSFKPYPTEFNKSLKELIRQRDNYKCQKCGCPEKECIRKLDIHHIDFNKLNLNPNNLISLCRKCNSKVNGERKLWQKKLKLLLLNKSYRR